MDMWRSCLAASFSAPCAWARKPETARGDPTPRYRIEPIPTFHSPMASHLLIVESPSKAKTLKKYLGKDYDILASYGHVRDLVPKAGAVDPDDNFRMKYELIERNARHVDAIAKAVKDADSVLLATDPDREGVAIAWHLA